MVEMIKVESSNVQEVGYFENDLYVKYANGIYIYTNVPRKLYEELVLSASKGKYLNENIKGKYEYRRI